MIKTYNKHATESTNAEWGTINPTVLGIIFTMVQIRNKSPISAQEQYMEAVKKLKMPIMKSYIRENKTSYGDAPEYGVPVVLKRVSGQTYIEVQNELEALTTEVLKKVESNE